MKKLKCEKINQFESQKLDFECKFLLKEAIISSFTRYSFKTYSFNPEIRLAIDCIYYYFTLNKGKNLPGNILQNIYLTQAKNIPISRRLSLIYFILSTLFFYLHERVKESKNLKLKDLFEKIEKIYNVFSFFNFLAFIFSGRYLTLAQRLLKIQYTYIDPEKQRF